MGSYILIALRGASIMSKSLVTSAKARKMYDRDLQSFLATNNITLEELVYNISPT